MKRRTFGAAALALALTLSVPSIASADTTIGSTTKPTGSNNGFGSTYTFVQQSSSSFPVAVPAGGGKITSWSTNTAGSTAGANVELVVLRPAGAGNFTVIAVDSETLPTPLPDSNLATFALASPIAVSTGDQIGIYVASGPPAIAYWQMGSTPATDVLSLDSTSPASPPAPGQTIQSSASGPGGRANVSAVVNQPATPVVTTPTTPTTPRHCTVPKLRGTPARVAKRMLKRRGCKVKVKRKHGKGVPHGAVLKTKPGPGTYRLGRKITLIVRK